jgi:chromosome segregation ATPase
MTIALHLNGELVQDTFRTWRAEQQSLDAQLTESLAALSAFQSHLDAWQQQLAHERDELQTLRQQIEHERSATDANQTQALAEVTKDLNASRDKVAALTTMLLSRTEELRTLDNRRAESATELELARAREKELKAALDEQKMTIERERAHWTQELRHMRELLERQLDDTPSPQQTPPAAPPSTTDRTQPVGSRSAEEIRENPVLGSIVEQFGKLRQQRSFDRQTFRKPR